MKPTIEILDRIGENSRNNKEEIFTRLYRYMLRPDLYYLAYKNLYANKGASTKGVDNDTADGFSKEKINGIIQSLTDETYTPKPVRREYIQKKRNSTKKRPLGIPTFTDKLVQEVLRMILESVYEPTFSNFSHGFRPNRSCHTALASLKKEFTGATWFIEGDIKGCFDNIDHHTLVGILGSKIKDARLIQLIWKFLKAGYMEEWTYHKTYSGCPQGGIVSPIISNIYLNELDKFAAKVATEFFKPKNRAYTAEYGRIAGRINYIKKLLKTAKGQRKTELLTELKAQTVQLHKVPFSPKTDKVMKYIRYADDFIIGVKGDRSDCERIKQQFSDFISQALKMELSDEKTLITHSNHYARFLGYDVRVRREQKLKPNGKGGLSRTLNGKVELNIPFADKIMPFLFGKLAIRQTANGAIEPAPRKYLYRCTDLEIISSYNSELRGICNYYGLASNFTRLDYFAYLMEYSCLKTLAGKHKTTSRKTLDKFHIKNGGWGIPCNTAKGHRCREFARYQDCKNADSFNDVIINFGARHAGMTTTFDDRLAAEVCELCGKMNVPLEIHHVNKVKNLKGKQDWEIIMIAKRRKTLAVCKSCHHKIHHP
jgi:group II intron reverse transcriptase/maturase